MLSPPLDVPPKPITSTVMKDGRKESLFPARFDAVWLLAISPDFVEELVESVIPPRLKLIDDESDFWTPLDIPPTWILSAPTTWADATNKFPDDRIPASPALMAVSYTHLTLPTKRIV